MSHRTKTLKTIAALAAAALIGGAATQAPALFAALAKQEGEMPMEKPGPEHKRLTELAGTWDYVSKLRMDPSAPWTESKGTEVIESACGGFWIVTKNNGDMMGMPMEGRQQLGYDTNKKKYVGTWIDNFGSYMTTMEGDWDEKTKTLTLHSDMFDPMSGSTVKTKMTTEHVSKDHTIFRMTFPSPDGKDFVGMEVDSKRRK
jgi:hypothetical protein